MSNKDFFEQQGKESNGKPKNEKGNKGSGDLHTPFIQHDFKEDRAVNFITEVHLRYLQKKYKDFPI